MTAAPNSGFDEQIFGVVQQVPARGAKRLRSGEATAARRNFTRRRTAGKTRMRTVVQTIIVALAVACCASACAQTLTGTATITDADTIVVGGETIRLQGVDAPETDQICLDSRGAVWNCGIDARDRLIRHIGSRQTSCVTNGKDVFGRWLATCSTNGGDLSAWLVREGLALAFVRYSSAYAPEEVTARSAQKGMWAGAFIAPWDWRARTASTAILGSYKPTDQ
jgi:endonuclease YncB( thermonuclease family)